MIKSVAADTFHFKYGSKTKFPSGDFTVALKASMDAAGKAAQPAIITKTGNALAGITAKSYQPTFPGEITTSGLISDYYFNAANSKYLASMILQTHNLKYMVWLSEASSGTYKVNLRKVANGIYADIPVVSGMATSMDPPMAVVDLRHGDTGDSFAVLQSRAIDTLWNSIYWVWITPDIDGMGLMFSLLKFSNGGTGVVKLYDVATFKPANSQYSLLFFTGNGAGSNVCTNLIELDLTSITTVSPLPRINRMATWKNSQNTTWAIERCTADNLNSQDYIYTIQQDTAKPTTNYRLARLKATEFLDAQDGADQTGDIFKSFTLVGDKHYLTLLNVDSQQYVLAVLEATSAEVYLFSKTEETFGKTAIAVKLPSAAAQTSATLAYGLFRTGEETLPSFYYQLPNILGEIHKATLDGCPAATPWWNPKTTACEDGTAAGFYKNAATNELEPCTDPTCASCPTSKDVCASTGSEGTGTTPGGTTPGGTTTTTVTTCAIANCQTCASATICQTCLAGILLSTEGKTCSLPETRQQIGKTHSYFSPSEKEAFVQLNRPAMNYPVANFTYMIEDKATSKIAECKRCKVATMDGNKMTFSVLPDTPILNGKLIVTFPLSLLKSTRILQASSQWGYLEIDDISIRTIDDKDNYKVAYDAFTAINAFRFFATIFLGVFNSVHSFWGTLQFSWLQLYANFSGQYLAYPDRLLIWHQKWYLLVINFGQPFTSWIHTNPDGTECYIQAEYPYSRLGCGFTNNFGQNFIIIICILAFSLAISAVMLYTWFFHRQENKYAGSQPQNQSWKQRILNQAYRGLGIPYFFRFMDAIQPSVMFFSLLQFNTFVSGYGNALNASLFFAICFFIYYATIAVLSFFLARKVWISLSKKREENQDLGKVAWEEGGWFRSFSFYYYGYSSSKVTYFFQLLCPILEYFRVLLITVFMVTLRQNPKASLGLIFCVEILRLAFIASTLKCRNSIFYVAVESITPLFFILFLVLKIASNNGYSETTIQENLGWAMAFFVAGVWAMCLADIIVDSWVTFKAYKSKAASDQGRLFTEASSPEGGSPVLGSRQLEIRSHDVATNDRVDDIDGHKMDGINRLPPKQSVLINERQISDPPRQ